MSWPTMTSGDVLSGAGAETRGADLFNRARICAAGGSTWYFAEVTESGASATDKVTWEIYIPDCVRSGDGIAVAAITDQGGGGEGYYRVRETGVPTNGDTQTLGAAPAAQTSTITVPDNTWAGTVKTIAVQLWTNGTGTASARADYIIGNVRFVAAIVHAGASDLLSALHFGNGPPAGGS